MQQTHRRFNPSRGGHAPGDLRAAFTDWVEQGSPEQPINHRLRGRLWNCTDTLPRSDCDTLDIAPGSTYAQAVRQSRR